MPNKLIQVNASAPEFWWAGVGLTPIILTLYTASITSKTNEPELGGVLISQSPLTAACNLLLCNGSSYPPRPRSYELPGITIYSYYKHRHGILSFLFQFFHLLFVILYAFFFLFPLYF